MTGAIDQSVPDECFRCGYLLLGIANDQACPECGLLAERSRRVTDSLHDTRPRWLHSLSRGTDLILFSWVLIVGWGFIEGFIEGYVNRHQLWNSIWFQRMDPMLGFEISSLIFLCGVFLLTQREGYPPADRADRKLRLCVRVVAASLLLSALVFAFSVQMDASYRIAKYGNALLYPQSDDYWQKNLTYIAAGWIIVSVIPLPCLLFFRLRGLAKRARNAELAEHCAIVGIGASAAILYVLAVAWFSNNYQKFGLSDTWYRRSTSSLMIIVMVLVVGILFVLWSLFLFIRFTIAFHKAARQLRQKWRRDDRAEAGG